MKEQGKRTDVGRCRPPKEHQFKPGSCPNPNGHPKGVKNRSTIVRAILEMKGMLPTDIFKKLKQMYPQVENKMTVEEIMAVVISHKAITKGDVSAYNAIMDSRYGKPSQAITGPQGASLFGKSLSDEEAKGIADAVLKSLPINE